MGTEDRALNYDPDFHGPQAYNFMGLMGYTRASEVRPPTECFIVIVTGRF